LSASGFPGAPAFTSRLNSYWSLLISAILMSASSSSARRSSTSFSETCFVSSTAAFTWSVSPVAMSNFCCLQLGAE
jgi:hypothetical protein